jgi:hypothetical protein
VLRLLESASATLEVGPSAYILEPLVILRVGAGRGGRVDSRRVNVMLVAETSTPAYIQAWPCKVLQCSTSQCGKLLCPETDTVTRG